MSWWLLKRKIHVSWLITVLCFSIFIGVFLAQYLKIWSEFTSIFLVISVVISVFVFWKKHLYLIPLLIVGGVLFGLWRGLISQVEISQIAEYYNTVVDVEGRVKDDVDISSSGQIVIRLDNLMLNGKATYGTFWIASDNADIERGDNLQLHGLLKPGFGSFSGLIYRATIDKITVPQPGDVARIVRDWFASGIKKVIPEPESSLGLGFLLGQRRALPIDLVTALQAVGLTHVVVASGYNLTILVRLARRLFVKISKYLSALFSIVMIVCFIAVAGLSPSMTRAGLVSILSLMAWYYGRKFHPVTLLAVAIATTVLLNPSYAWGDLGWQLSFAAFAGVMIVAPLFQRYFFGDKKPGTIRQILGETVAAQMVTAPLIIMAFGQISNIAIVSNLMVLPFVPLAMSLVFITGVIWLVLPGVVFIFSVPTTWLLSYMVKVTEWLSNLPWALSVIKPQLWMIILYYFMLSVSCVYMAKVTKFKLREVNLVE